MHYVFALTSLLLCLGCVILQLYRNNFLQLHINNTVTHFFLLLFLKVFFIAFLYSPWFCLNFYLFLLSAFQVFEISNLAISVSVPALIFVLLVVRFSLQVSRT